MTYPPTNFCGVFFLLQLITGGLCLHGVKLSVPQYVSLGSPAVLSCQYLLDRDLLYTVKWYKGGREFYRYTPKEEPPFKIFPMPSIMEYDIKREESNATQVSLRQVSGSMAGSYSCEVSADAPSFHTVVVTAHLDVVDTPSEEPTLRGLKPQYRAGEWIRANCTSPGSKPAANITWTANGHHVAKESTRLYREVDVFTDLEVSISSVRLLARSHLFPGGRLRLTCIASIYNLYWKTAEKSASLLSPTADQDNDVYDVLSGGDEGVDGRTYREQGPYRQYYTYT